METYGGAVRNQFEPSEIWMPGFKRSGISAETYLFYSGLTVCSCPRCVAYLWRIADADWERYARSGMTLGP